jgi:soluble lytic murein transglycosylase-like protein
LSRRLPWNAAAQALAALALACLALPCRAIAPPQFEEEAPRARALLEQAWSAEDGQGYALEPRLALMLYCHAGVTGSAEGYFRLGRLLVEGPAFLRDEAKGRGYWALAAQLGHERAAVLLDERAAAAAEPDCAAFETALQGSRFDMRRYVAGLSAQKRAIAELILHDAPKLDVPAALALAVACAESNLNAQAVSPKNAQGVMQLIPETAKRFGVSEPFDARQNIRGGLRYIKWLLAKFEGNLAHAVAAYNAGEGNVIKYRGVPPFAETQAYVKRVLYYAGFAEEGLPQPAKRKALKR